MFYTQEQIDMAQDRMEKAGRKPPSHFTKAKVSPSMLPSVYYPTYFRRFSDFSRPGISIFLHLVSRLLGLPPLRSLTEWVAVYVLVCQLVLYF